MRRGAACARQYRILPCAAYDGAGAESWQAAAASNNRRRWRACQHREMQKSVPLLSQRLSAAYSGMRAWARARAFRNVISAKVPVSAAFATPSSSLSAKNTVRAPGGRQQHAVIFPRLRDRKDKNLKTPTQRRLFAALFWKRHLMSPSRHRPVRIRQGRSGRIRVRDVCICTLARGRCAAHIVPA